jgi:ATP-binding cassette subfamily F protein 3
MRAAQSDLAKAEAAIARLSAEVETLDREILSLSGKAGGQSGAAMQGLLTKRARAADALATAEETWLAAGAALEAFQAA